MISLLLTLAGLASSDTGVLAGSAFVAGAADEFVTEVDSASVDAAFGCEAGALSFFVALVSSGAGCSSALEDTSDGELDVTSAT